MSAVTRRYGRTTAVDGLSWTAYGGQVTCVLGPNGAGRSTAVHLAVGLQRPDSGEVGALGTDPWHFPRRPPVPNCTCADREDRGGRHSGGAEHALLRGGRAAGRPRGHRHRGSGRHGGLGAEIAAMDQFTTERPERRSAVVASASLARGCRSSIPVIVLRFTSPGRWRARAMGATLLSDATPDHGRAQLCCSGLSAAVLFWR